MLQSLEKLSLPEPDFSKTTEDNLMFEVMKEMHQTNFLENYYDRFERCREIIKRWTERTTEIYNENRKIR